MGRLGALLALVVLVIAWRGCCQGERTLREDQWVDGDKQLRTLQQTTEGKIAFGIRAPCGRYPYMVSVRDRDNKHICGGVLVQPQWVLTSAHCASNKTDVPLSEHGVVVIGACNLDDELNERNEGNVTVEVFQILETNIHENWRGVVENGSDIALLMIGGQSQNIPVTMALDSAPVFTTERFVAIGWDEDRNGEVDEALREAGSMEIIQNEHCHGEDVWPFIRDDMICAAGIFSRENTCQGNLGGPLLKAFAPRGKTETGKPDFDIVVGILSVFDDEVDCGMEQRPGVYTRLSSFRKWVDNKILEGNKKAEQIPIEVLRDSLLDENGTTVGAGPTPIRMGNDNESNVNEDGVIGNQDKRDRCRWCLTPTICVMCKSDAKAN